jgi:hypothetical protein
MVGGATFATLRQTGAASLSPDAPDVPGLLPGAAELSNSQTARAAVAGHNQSVRA